MAIAVTTEPSVNCVTGAGAVIHALEGVTYVTTRDDEWILTPGDTAIVPAGTDFRRWSAGDEQARWVETHC